MSKYVNFKEVYFLTMHIYIENLIYQKILIYVTYLLQIGWKTK